MKLLRKLLIVLFILLALGVIVGIVLIKKFSFQLTEWEYPAEMTVSDQDRPNILLLVAEDLSAKVGAFGDEIAHTPNIDRLAKMGIRYPNTFTTAGVCSPSRAALITGMHQISMGGQHMRTGSRPEGAYLCVPPPNVKAFPELLRREGYFTFNTSKLDYQFSGATPGSGPFTIWDAENDTQLWRSRKESQPFFGMMNFLETHESGVFTPLGNRPNNMMHFLLQVFRKIGMTESDIRVDPNEITLPPYYPDASAIRKDIARHYENIAAMDALIGDILERLEKDGLMENTIIIWTTDHGDGLPRSKRELYDSGIKVPMIVYYPEKYRPANVQPGSVDNQLISFLDFAPSFLELGNAPIPDYMPGRNFMVEDSIQRSYIYASRDRIDEVLDRQRAVRNDRFKYIKSWYPEQEGGHPLAFRDNLKMMQKLWELKAKGELNEEQLVWFEDPGEERLFDLQKDPFELNDVSQDTTYLEELAIMRQALAAWLEKTEDWSEVSEQEMVDRFQPKGILEKTANPIISIKNDSVYISCPTEGASLAYQIDDGPWQLYTQAFRFEETSSNGKFKAIRYGWEESEEVNMIWKE